MKKMLSCVMMALLGLGCVVFATARADEKEGGGKSKSATVLGKLAEIKEAEKIVSLTVGRKVSKYTLADQLTVKIDDKPGKLADLKPGTVIQVKLSEDKKSIVEIAAGEKIKLGEQKAEGKEAPAPKRPEGKEAPAPKRPEGKEAPAPKRPEGKEAPAPKRPEGNG
jgi:hypothetical protein